MMWEGEKYFKLLCLQKKKDILLIFGFVQSFKPDLFLQCEDYYMSGVTNSDTCRS